MIGIDLSLLGLLLCLLIGNQDLKTHRLKSRKHKFFKSITGNDSYREFSSFYHLVPGPMYSNGKRIYWGMGASLKGIILKSKPQPYF